MMEFLGPNGILYGLGAVVVVAVIAWLKGIMTGGERERDKQAAAEAKARDVADEVENDIGSLTPEQRRERLRQWSRR